MSYISGIIPLFSTKHVKSKKQPYHGKNRQKAKRDEKGLSPN